MSIDTPLKWILDALPGYIEPEALASLMTRYRAHKASYELQIKINKVERIVKVFESRNHPSEAARLARWKAKLAKLKDADGKEGESRLWTGLQD